MNLISDTCGPETSSGRPNVDHAGLRRNHFAFGPVASVSEGLSADVSESEVRHFTIDIGKTRHRARNPAYPDKLILVDTPGFDNQEINDMEILHRLNEFLATRCSLDAQFGGIIYFHDITQDRGAMEYNQTWPAAYLTDPEPIRHLLLVTTKWDHIPAPPYAANYEEREERLSRTVWSRMLGRGARIMRFMNTEDSAWMVLLQLLELQPLDLHILQKDLMRIKKPDQFKGGPLDRLKGVLA
ncbi:hypothetical protein NMY22_g9686 [Coprinellus aureogranulatus]|nr:hypothetical protein NMY22_g9686 [Coprinellus aureogranulatus]